MKNSIRPENEHGKHAQPNINRREDSQKKGAIHMHCFKPVGALAFAIFALVLFVPAKVAIAQGPDYLRAISDLRQARTYLEMDRRPTFRGQLSEAIKHITASIEDMKAAAVHDRENPNQTPPPQSTGDPNSPVHEALRLLHDAHDDVARGGDAPGNAGLQERSLGHIEAARHQLQYIVNQQ